MSLSVTFAIGAIWPLAASAVILLADESGQDMSDEGSNTGNCNGNSRGGGNNAAFPMERKGRADPQEEDMLGLLCAKHYI
jgi:hypothetical protein